MTHNGGRGRVCETEVIFGYGKPQEEKTGTMTTRSAWAKIKVGTQSSAAKVITPK
jgi:hypothetical protein